MSNSDSWCTPPAITNPLAMLMGGPVDVDPCSNDRSIVQARLALTTGGLIRPWRLTRPVDRSVYQNDPYSKAAPWTAKMLHEMACDNVKELVRLCMMSTSSQWWADMCMSDHVALDSGKTGMVRNPRILALRRIAFLDPFAAEAGLKRQSCRFEPALIYFGSRSKEFDREFKHLTRWSTWGR